MSIKIKVQIIGCIFCLNFLIVNKSLSNPSEGLQNMLKTEEIRLLLPYSKTFYYLDGAQQKGLTYELGVEFEKFINKKFPNDQNKIKVVFIPTLRNDMINDLLSEKGDVIASNMYVTDKQIDDVTFSKALFKDTYPVLLSKMNGTDLENIDQLSAQKIAVRKSSIYFKYIEEINAKLIGLNLAPIEIIKVDEFLEDEDIMELVHAGVYDFTVVDKHLAGVWLKAFSDLFIHQKLSIHDTPYDVAWLVRKENKELLEVLNEFINENKKGTFIGNVLFNRYIKNSGYIKKQGLIRQDQTFIETIKFIKQYAKKYGFDWLMITALSFQESQLNQDMVSHVGAIGVMQLMKSTATDKNVDIPNIEILEHNVHAGVKYLHFIHNRYFSAPEIDQLNQWLFTFASYNAGPARVRQLRTKAAESGKDPNQWFGHVELIAAEVIGRETVQYVSNIYKYYIAYSRSKELLEKKLKNKNI